MLRIIPYKTPGKNLRGQSLEIILFNGLKNRNRNMRLVGYFLEIFPLALSVPFQKAANGFRGW
jgi:hypothetical protein